VVSAPQEDLGPRDHAAEIGQNWPVSLATLIIAAVAASFTALAAIAALWTAKIARDEARQRAEPYIAAEPPALSTSGDEVEIDVKNLGLGPARLLGLLVQSGAQVIGAYRSTGLAPMEPKTISIPLRLWTSSDPPPLEQITVSGECQDAAGRFHPLFIDGYERSADRDAVARYAAFADRSEIRMRHELKAVVRWSATGNASASTAAWMRFWQWIEATGTSPERVEEQVRSDWEQLGAAGERFVRRSDLILTDEDRRRHETEPSV
jgi:hypothetical protein